MTFTGTAYELTEHVSSSQLERRIHKLSLFSVACFAILHPVFLVRLSVGPSVRQLVRPSVTFYFLFFAVFDLTAPAQMMEWP